MNSATLPAPTTAVHAALARLRRRLPRTLLFMLVLCTAIAVLLNTFESRGLGRKAIYSFAIGFTCWAITEGTRVVQAAVVDLLRRRRGLSPSPSGFDTGWRGVVLAVMAAVLIGPSLGMSFGDLLTGGNSPSLLQWNATNTRVTIAMTIIASLASVFVLSTMERLARAREQAEAAQRQAAEHQLKLLQSQLEPHMLFNTLANLRVLIGLDPPRAQAMLDRMIAFLRSTLEASRVDRHALSAEFERLSDYLALMAVRMGPRLQVRLELPEALRALPVPPLLLQPLVENAIHHGLEPKVEGGRIELLARRDGASLLLQVRDTGLGLGHGVAGGTGFGLTQVRERLATLYGARASLRLEAAAGADGGVLVSVRLPID